MRFPLPLATTVAFLAITVVGLRSPSAQAKDPPPILTTTECFMTADPGGGVSGQLPFKGTISPSGSRCEDIHVKVTVRTALGTPLPGVTVAATAVGLAGAAFRWDDGLLPPGDVPENPQTGITGADGVVELVFDEGGVALPPFPWFPDLDFALTVQGPGPGAPIPIPGCDPQLSVISFDANADGRVNLPDFAVFALFYGTGDLRGDFDWSGRVNLVDFAIFASHYGDDLNAQ